METSSWEAWKNRDGKFFEGFLSGDHVEIGFSGVTNKESVVRSVGSPSCIVKGYKIDGFELKIIDQTTALLTYHAWQETTCNGKPVPTPVWVGSLYQKRNGKWLNVVYQQSQELSGGQGN